MKHPARFSDAILDIMREWVTFDSLLLDPFAGTGLIHKLPCRTVGVEIEPEWATMHPDTVVGNALSLPFDNETFDGVATSPCYGNRFADHHHARDGSMRRSYTHDLGRALHRDNAGTLHWGDEYRNFHQLAWSEVVRVLRRDGYFILNIKDHVRGGMVQPVTDWHVDALDDLSLDMLDHIEVRQPGMRYGENNRARVEHESVILFVKR